MNSRQCAHRPADELGKWGSPCGYKEWLYPNVELAATAVRLPITGLPSL